MTTPINPVELAYHIHFWEDRLGIKDEDVLTAFVADHMVRMNEQMAASFSEDLGEFGRRLDIEKAKQTSNIAHILRLKTQFQKLSKGFPLRDDNLLGYFERGTFLQDDMRYAITDAGKPPRSYPSGLVPLSFIFTRVVKPELPQDFWQCSPFHQEFMMAVTHMNDEVLGSIDPKMSPLLCYFHHHRFSDILSDMESTFKVEKRHNWARVAGLLSRQNAVAADDIHGFVRTQIAGRSHPYYAPLCLPPPQNS